VAICLLGKGTPLTPSAVALGMHVVSLVAAKKSSGGSPYVSIIFLVLLFGLGYFLFLRPARARAARQRSTQRELAVGEQVMTTAGLFGAVAAVEDDHVLIEVAPGVTTKWAKAAIAQVISPVEAAGLHDDTIEDPPESTPGDTDSDDRPSGPDS
jgi:preprotein translocase subunit YajC